MTEELKKAIELVEENGGIVMMQELMDNEEIDALIEKEAQEKAELEKWQEERKIRLKGMAEDFSDILKSKNFSVTAVEDMVHGYGCDLDDLEDLIHNYY